MRRKRYVSASGIGLLIAVLLLWSGCDDDEYTYPPVVTEFVDAHVDASHLIDHIVTDRAETLTLENRVSAKELRPDSFYRAISIYERNEAYAGQAKMYSIQLVFAAEPVTEEELKQEVKTDPLSIQSLWRGGEYLNIIALPKAQNIPHAYYFIEDSIKKEDGITKVYLKLYHNRNNDLEAYEQKTYLSIPLRNYGLRQGDSLYFRAQTYKKGFQTWKMAY